jgi:uncharacterized membrane protein YfhO
MGKNHPHISVFSSREGQESVHFLLDLPPLLLIELLYRHSFQLKYKYLKYKYALLPVNLFYILKITSLEFVRKIVEMGVLDWDMA